MGFLSLAWFFGKSVRSTGVHVRGIRCVRRQIEFRPDGFTGNRAEFDAPAVRERLDEKQAASGLGLGIGAGGRGPSAATDCGPEAAPNP
ncbi:hypothetical protein GCM10017557_43000 [Streptomyces aurantiacus]|uniref:Uncharacterized protein n=1 Tax=Streptomyces aurantiacus TaxID=47760 RepID=A0A7G1P433_9ACTN|nr:hypothetical protein GCM10017557_43000 [Streptomyces aurantiacus]